MKKKLLLCLICFACVLASLSTGFTAFAANEPGEGNISFTPTYDTSAPTYTLNLSYVNTSSNPRQIRIYDNSNDLIKYYDLSVGASDQWFNLSEPNLSYNTIYRISTHSLHTGSPIIVNGHYSAQFSNSPDYSDITSSSSSTPSIITGDIRISSGTPSIGAFYFQKTISSFSVSFNGQEFPINYNGNISGIFTADTGYALPDTITVSMNDEVVPANGYTYNATTGAFEIQNITGDIEITAEAVEYPTVTINSNEDYTTTLPDHIIVGGNLSGTITPEDDDLIIRNISVEMVGNQSEVVNYTFDRSTGAFYLPGVTGDVTIDLTIGEPPTEAELLGDTLGGFIAQIWEWTTEGAEAIMTSPILIVLLVAVPVGTFVIYLIVRLIKRGSR